jgi:hypothetical protein
VKLNITAHRGMLSSEAFRVFHLKNHVDTITQTDTEVLFEGKEAMIHFTKIFFKVRYYGAKTTFYEHHRKRVHVRTIKNQTKCFCSSDSDKSGSSSSTTDSGLWSSFSQLSN